MDIVGRIENDSDPSVSHSQKRLRNEEKEGNEKKSRNCREKENGDSTSFKTNDNKIDNDESISHINSPERNENKNKERNSIEIDNDNETEKYKGKEKEKELERKKRYQSKTAKWTDFTVWVDSLVSEAEKNEKMIGIKAERELESSDIVSSSNDKDETKISNNDHNDSNNHKKMKTKIRNAHRKYDVIVDGANVGYYKQNFSGAPSHIDYRQVDWMLRQLICRGTYVHCI